MYQPSSKGSVSPTVKCELSSSSEKAIGIEELDCGKFSWWRPEAARRAWHWTSKSESHKGNGEGGEGPGEVRFAKQSSSIKMLKHRTRMRSSGEMRCRGNHYGSMKRREWDTKKREGHSINISAPRGLRKMMSTRISIIFCQWIVELR